ncbi:radical SAM protein [Thermodesulfobacteriota bacterium]
MNSHLISTIRNLSAFAGPFLTYHIRGAVNPMLAGYKITHKCNLKCSHCPYWRRTGTELDYIGAVSTLTRLRKMGVKILILEGGEPLLWRDGRKTIRDVAFKARDMFPCVCVTTNGTIPWGDLPFDRVWVSLDGPRSVHDEIRGDGIFDRVLTNLEREGKGRAFISTTISKTNAHSIPELLTILKGKVEGVTIQFYFPYYGLPDPVFLPPEDRIALLEELAEMKTLGYPVANSFLSLDNLKQRLWVCEDKLLANAEPDGKILHGCYLKNRGRSECSVCGFTAHNEMSLAFRGKWQSIVTGARIFFGNRSPVVERSCEEC